MNSNPNEVPDSYRLSFERSRHYNRKAHPDDMEFRLESRWRALRTLRNRRNRIRLDRLNRDLLIAEMMTP